MFDLFSAPTGGSPIGSTLAANGVAVESGVFTVELDFGPAAFDGAERWLEIRVATPANSGGGPFTTLSPRQRFAAVPYALYAVNAKIAGVQTSAVALTNPSNSYNGSAMTIDGGTLHVDAPTNRVGIGTTAPLAPLHVAGSHILVDTNVPFSGVNIRSGGTTVAQLGQSDNNLWLTNANAGSVIFGTWPTTGLTSDRMRIFTSGRIRMGPANLAPEPSSTVHIIDGAAGVPMHGNSSLALERNNFNYLNILAPNNRETGVLFGKPTGGAEAGGVVYNNFATPDGLQFRVNGNQTYAAISSAGNLGIGQGNTGPIARLDVFNEQLTSSLNTAIFRAPNTGANISHVHYGPTGDWYIRSASGAGNVVIQDSGGNVGVGASSPSSKLHVYDGSVTIDPAGQTNGGLALESDGTLLGMLQVTSPTTMSLANFNAGPIAFGTGTTPGGALTRMTITPEGRVGIGVGSPATALHVAGGATVVGSDISVLLGGVKSDNGFAARAGGLDVGWLFVSTNGLNLGNFNAGPITFGTQTFPGSTVARMRINPDGTVGVNTLATSGFTFAVNGSAAKPGGGLWDVFSDARLKNDIRDLPAGTLERLLQLRGREFRYSQDAIDHRFGLPGVQTGFIAQEVESVFPEWVSEDKEGYKYISERGTTALLVEALRELRAERDMQIEQQTDRIEAQQREIDELRAANAAMASRLAAIERALTRE